MKYFIFSLVIITIVVIIFLFIKNKKNKSMFINTSDEKIIKDLKYLRKRLLTETDPNVRIEIQKKIEIITSFYN